MRLDTPHGMLRSGTDTAVLFKPGGQSSAVYDIAKMSMRQRSTDSPIVNVECTGRLVIVFHRELHNEYDRRTLELLNTVAKAGVTFKYMTGRSASIMVRGNEMLIARDKRAAPEVQRIEWAALVRGRYLCVCSKSTLDIFEAKSKVYSAPVVDQGHTWVDVRNEKVYLLQGGRIRVHDLNLYLDELADFSPSRFTNIENEVLLYDAARKELRLYQKNLAVLLFSCDADDYAYEGATCQLFVVSRGQFAVYRRLNECRRDFRLADESVAYTEQEDEFDESDSSYADIVTGSAHPL